MARMSFTVEAVGEKVRLKQEDGTYTDFSPAPANQMAGGLIKAAMEANGQIPPKALTITFHFE